MHDDRRTLKRSRDDELDQSNDVVSFFTLLPHSLVHSVGLGWRRGYLKESTRVLAEI